MKMKQATAILLALGLILAGCAGGGDSAQPQTQEPAQAATEAVEEATEEAAEAAEAVEEEAVEEVEAAEAEAAEGNAAGSEEAPAETDVEPAEPEPLVVEDDFPNRTVNDDGTVDLLIPAYYTEGAGEEEYASFMEGYGIDSFTQGDDGSVTFHMTQETYDAMLASMVEDLESLLAGIPGDENVVGVESVEHNDRFTVFTVKKSSRDFGAYEAFYFETYCTMAGQYYNLYLGDPVDSVHIEWVDQETGEILKELDTSEEDSFSDSFYSDEENALRENLTVNEDFAYTVVDNDDIKFEFTGMTYEGDYFYTWNYHIDNKTDQQLTFMSDMVCVNGILCDPYLYQKVDAGQSVDGEMSWSISALADNHLTDVTVVDFGLEVEVSGKWNDEVFHETQTIYPIGEENAITEFYSPREEDQLIADNEYGRAYIIGYDTSDYFDMEVTIYIENKSDLALNFASDKVTVGGAAINPYWSQALPAGKGGFRNMNFAKGSFAENGLTDDFTLSFDLLIKELDNYFGEPLTTDHVEATPAFG